MSSINYLTHTFSTYKEVFQILDYKTLLPLNVQVYYDMLFNEYNSNITSPMDLINYLNELDPSILPAICSFIHSMPHKIETNQSSSIEWACPGKVTVINGRKNNMRLLGEINQINNKVKVLFLVALAYCDKNCCDQFNFNYYDLWDTYWGPTSHPLFPEMLDCGNIVIDPLHDTITITIVDNNNTYTVGSEHHYLIKIVRITDGYFKSTSYLILKQKESIKLTNLISGTYEISVAVSYTNNIDGINDYVWSDFCRSTSTPIITVSMPGYVVIDNEVYWEYHFVLPADHLNTDGGLPRYIDKYKGKMRNYFLTWWYEATPSSIGSGKLVDGSATLGGASLENCSYDIRYTINKPTEDSIWISGQDLTNIPFQNSTDYKNPTNTTSGKPVFQDLNDSPYQKITVLGYQNIWVQMRIRNQFGVPDWPIVDGYPTGNFLGYNEVGDELYGYKVETNTPPYFKNVLTTDISNCEYQYTVGTFSWGAPADKMSPVQQLAAVSVQLQVNFVFTPPVTWWTTNSNDNTSDYQNNFKPDIKPVFIIFPLYTQDAIHPQEDNYNSPIYRAYDNIFDPFRPIFIFTDKYYNPVTDTVIPEYTKINNYPTNCDFKNKLPNYNSDGLGFNFIDALHYNTDSTPECGLSNGAGYFYHSINTHTLLFFINSNKNETKFNYTFNNSLGNVSLNLDILKVSIGAFNPTPPIRIGIKVINLDDLRITNHRYPYNFTISAITIPPFNISGSIGGKDIPIIQRMNIDVQYSDPVNIHFEPSPNEIIIFYSYYTFNNYDSNDPNSTLTLLYINQFDFYIKQGATNYYLNENDLTLTPLDNNTFYLIYIEIDGIEKQLSDLYTPNQKEIYQSYIIPRYYLDTHSFGSILYDSFSKNILFPPLSGSSIHIDSNSILHLKLTNMLYGLDTIFPDYIYIYNFIKANSKISVKLYIYNPVIPGYNTCSNETIHIPIANFIDESSTFISITSPRHITVPTILSDTPPINVDDIPTFAIKVEISYNVSTIYNKNIRNPYGFKPVYMVRTAGVYQTPTLVMPTNPCNWTP